MMKSIAAHLGAGALFGAGLGVAGMTKTSKVIGFLDVFGAWDASLAFVMVGAIAVHHVALRRIVRRRAPLFGSTFRLPRSEAVDGRLVLGAALFGVGWGLGGYCPGPGLVSLASGALPALLFVVGMTVGMKAEHLAGAARARAGAADAGGRVTSRPPSGGGASEVAK